MPVPPVPTPPAAATRARPGAAKRDFFARYVGTPGRYDELLDGTRQPRAHWSKLCEELRDLSPSALNARLEAVAREIRDTGITYNVYADPQGLDRPWNLDCLPLILPAAEWAVIEAGVIQRATLLNAILADIYGEGRLLQDGSLPPAVILGHSGYLRAARGMRIPGGVHLHHYAADLARSPDGAWWVLADRSQAPSGAGYALENRLMVARLFPDLFQQLGVHRLAGYFAALRDALQARAPTGDGDCLIVVLTPGPYNETYFEHALLSRYLGFPLVEGNDLTVREGRLWLKTLEGLRRVHAVLRRQDDSYCDPLELRADSALGVPGLADCARQGTVLIANALGSGILESGALLGFLPGLCRTLLGEALRLPSVATWWCGEPAALDDALSRIDRLVFKPADPAFGFEPVFGQDLAGPALARFRAALRAEPARYIAQELVQMSQAPSFGEGSRLEVRAIGLRVFAVATADGYMVMPGGLTRVATQSDPRVISSQRGGSSKDTWILPGGSPKHAAATLLGDRPRQDSVIVSSRTAENLFWFGRYAERCDGLARFLRVAINARVQDAERTMPALTVLAGRLGLDEVAAGDTQAWCDAATFDSAAGGLASNLRQLARVGFGLRERMSLDNWRALNRLIQDPALGRRVSVAETLAWLNRVIAALMTVAGFALDGMTRDLGWRFLSIGRRLERLAFLCTALEVALDTARPGGLTWLLETGDAIVTYRARYRTRTDWPSVLELLVFEADNPRAVVFQLRGLHDYLEKLARAIAFPHVAPIRDLRERLASAPADPDDPELRALIPAVRSAAWNVSDQLSALYFEHPALVREGGGNP